jgi:hypothetical protein
MNPSAGPTGFLTMLREDDTIRGVVVSAFRSVTQYNERDISTLHSASQREFEFLTLQKYQRLKAHSCKKRYLSIMYDSFGSRSVTRLALWASILYEPSLKHQTSPYSVTAASILLLFKLIDLGLFVCESPFIAHRKKLRKLF